MRLSVLLMIDFLIVLVVEDCGVVCSWVIWVGESCLRLDEWIVGCDSIGSILASLFTMLLFMSAVIDRPGSRPRPRPRQTPAFFLTPAPAWKLGNAGVTLI